MHRKLCVLGVSLCLFASVTAFAGTIRGDYVESRTADVYTGPCFANGEVGLTGNDATLAWKIREGSWNGVALDGLTVVVVARGRSTLGDPYHDPYPARAVVILDKTATDSQAAALEEFARAAGGRLVENVVEIRRAPIQMETSGGHHSSSVVLVAGDDTEIRTRPISDKDHFCGNETAYYPPLTELSHAMPAYALSHKYTGNALGAEWKVYGTRSAFVGTFELGPTGTR